MKNLQSFLLLIIIQSFLVFFSKELLETNQVFVSSLSEKISYDQINEILAFKEKWGWIVYIFIPILLFIKIVIITTVINIGCFLFGKNISYSQIFNITIKSEFIFLLVIVFKTAWFYFFEQDYNLNDLQFFYPLSALNIVGYEGIDPWWIYPLQVFNLFELAYWFILAYLIGKAINSDTDKGINIVASSNGVALLIWVVGVMFFTLNVS
ncbi:hypothetical protein ESY86_10055 [Subsaximicrobium wynnwilliamsii]|uniref:Yip1 domain-containing protein n=1 Tax=Subsaximicrobium wynnwilliamsii TaxID=291179 RepID=A0A5C6ZKF9_9FLAO|nr:hypothetical protein [Subsaximicrobium wynnwilliamsii]TXD83359.1 hypothetical protein ESY87_10365 [Subsaximicrobium wynnwilliamsii]TXD89104.1 hypothetical protein ESY86_10055 [Subsaximicrobium wynnwilliamsii]TXE03383.1 hypothetical protein ESY88_08665 [Subsaximicrobium wynnwilliamsii]